jgi:hypothetical protein
MDLFYSSGPDLIFVDAYSGFKKAGDSHLQSSPDRFFIIRIQ